MESQVEPLATCDTETVVVSVMFRVHLTMSLSRWWTRVVQELYEE